MGIEKIVFEALNFKLSIAQNLYFNVRKISKSSFSFRKYNKQLTLLLRYFVVSAVES